ncbi:MAG: type I-E CRISPR-associated protein Cse1/CasA [Hyphomicrobiaceae bacterium]
MTEPFSLARQAWIPVALDDGRRVFVRPCEVSQPFDGRTILRVATGRPDCDISLTEFLIGLLAVAIGPKDRRDWVQRYRNPPTAAELETAFAPFDAALLLDGDGPRFFQDLDPLAGGPSPIEGLLIDAPGGNTIKENADHFVKRGRSAALSRSGAAIVLATLQTSAPAGGAGNRTSLRGGGPLTTIIVPGTQDNREPSLWERLWANVPAGMQATAADIQSVFPWTTATRVSDKSGKTTTPDDVHPAQAFFGMPRRIRLNFEPNGEQHPCDLLGIVDDVVVTGYVTRPWGTNYTAWSQGHPLSPYYRMKETDLEFLPLHLQSSRVGYRQWLGMVMEGQKGLRVPARCLTEFPQRARDLVPRDDAVLRRARLLVAGYAMDNMKPLDFAEALLPLILTGSAIADDAIKELARHWVEAADMVANQTVTAVRLALYGEKSKADRDSTVLEAVKARFWADTDDAFYAALRSAADSLEAESDSECHADMNRAASAGWLATLRRHALAIFDDAVPIEDAEGHRIEDIITGRKMLGLMLNGQGKGGAGLYQLLDQPSPEAKPRRARKTA